MEIITKAELRLRYEEIMARIKKGAVFIHPTDTIYGLSCNALNKKAVQRIRKIKERPTSPFSVWVDSPKWIKENCLINKKDEKWLAELPGPYTIIANLKKKDAVVKEVIPETNTLGLRCPNHWFNKIVGDLKIPLVTTSVNKSGQPFMTSLNNLDPEIEMKVEFIIYEGEKKVKPSKIINLSNEGAIISR